MGRDGGALLPDPLDRRVLEQFLTDIGGDWSSVVELVGMYLDDAPKLVNAIHVAVQRGDAAALGVASHTLKSTSASMGALVLSAQCNKLQELATSGNLAGAPELATQLSREFARVQTQLSMDYR